MFAPDVRMSIFHLQGGRITFNEETNKIIDEVFDEIHKIRPCGDDGRREIWLKAARGPIESFGDFEEYKEWGEVETYEEFVEWWKGLFPEETMWHKMVSVERDSYRAIFLGRDLIYQSEINAYEKEDCKADFSAFFTWVRRALREVVTMLQAGTYNADVAENLPLDERTGIILRKDLWDIFPESRENYFEKITPEQVKKFLELIEDQTSDGPVGEYIADMTAAKFYEFCRLGYLANEYEGADTLSAKELYYRYADGRDEGLREINENSTEVFSEWYNDRRRWGGHPWEVCAGGNSTHVSLYINDSGKGYYLSLAGKSWSRSIETVKFYLAIRETGTAVYLYDAEGIASRLLEQDYLGIVPQEITPAYCEGLFPGYAVLDFMHFPYENREEVAAKTQWLPEEEVKLINVRRTLVTFTVGVPLGSRE